MDAPFIPSHDTNTSVFLQSLVALLPPCLKRVAGIKFINVIVPFCQLTFVFYTAASFCGIRVVKKEEQLGTSLL